MRVVAVGEAMVEFAPVGDALYRRGFAGDTFNTIWHMAQILGPRASCGYVTRIGTDPLSDTFAAELAADGIDVSTVGRDPDRTMGLYVIELKGAERSFQYWRSASAARALADDPGALDAALDGTDLIHLSGITLAILPPEGRATLLDALAAARRAGARVAFDPNYRPRLWASADEARAALRRMLPLADVALPSFDDEAALWGDDSPAATRDRMAAAGAAEIVVKDGPRSVHLRAGGEDLVLPTPAAREVRDTSGAGDSFGAGYLAARMTGAGPAAAVALAQAVAAEVIRHPGARAPRDAVRALGQAMLPA